MNIYSTPNNNSSIVDGPATYSGEDLVNTPYKIVHDFIYVGIDKVVYQVTFSFGLGLFFAPWSGGLFILILFILSFELIYGMIIQKFTVEQFMIRIAIISSYFIGWLLGRVVIGDTKPVRLFFNDGFQEMGSPGHRHPALKRKHRRAPISTRILLGDDLKEKNGHRYVNKPIIVDTATYKTDPMNQAESGFDLIADEYELLPEPSMPVISEKQADDILLKIMTACHK